MHLRVICGYPRSLWWIKVLVLKANVSRGRG